MKVRLLNSFHLNDHAPGFRPQILHSLENNIKREHSFHLNG